MEKEIWKYVQGYEGIYKVSSLGNVMSFNRSKAGKLLKININNRGFGFINLPSGSIGVHRLVLETFTEKEGIGLEVHHKNGIKLDNRLINLEWSTHSENLKHAHKIGTKKPTRYWKGKSGKHHNLSKKVAKCDLNSNIIEVYFSAREASRKTGIGLSNISDVCTGRCKSAGGYKWKYF